MGGGGVGKREVQCAGGRCITTNKEPVFGMAHFLELSIWGFFSARPRGFIAATAPKQ